MKIKKVGFASKSSLQVGCQQLRLLESLFLFYVKGATRAISTTKDFTWRPPGACVSNGPATSISASVPISSWALPGFPTDPTPTTPYSRKSAPCAHDQDGPRGIQLVYAEETSDSTASWWP